MKSKTLKKYRISFCVVCMNRLHQLCETLLQNIKDNEEHDELEFVVLNYNSSDGMDEWMKEHMGPYILSGKISYYHTIEPKVFSHSHSKNIAFKLATGDIVCNINADHFTGKGFASYVNQEFCRNNQIVLTTIDYFRVKKDYNLSKDVFGKVCVRREDFFKIGGFDERMNNYGFEDWDFVNRLELNGIKRVLIENLSFLNFISHQEEERYSLKENMNNLGGIYIRYCTPSMSEVIFLYKDKRFEQGMLIDNSTMGSDNYVYAYTTRHNRFEYSLKEKRWSTGQWEEVKGSQVVLFNSQGGVLNLEKLLGDTILKTRDCDKYYLISDRESVQSLLTFSYFYHNRSVMEKNLEDRRVLVNENGFGNCTILRKG